MSLLAVTVGSDPSTVVDAVRAVGWYGVRVGQRLARGVIWWRWLADAGAGHGVWRSPRWRLVSCCVVAARERYYAGSACELV